MKKRILMGIIMFVIIGILGQTNKVEAALQSNGGTPLKANLNDWIYYTRKMQEAGGTLGLTDTISDTDLSSSNKNLDIHFQKNTEYGAMTILSASAYGNPNKIEDGGTTTGNASGIQINLNTEWVAAGPDNTQVGKMKNAAARYWNNYGTGNGSNSKNGDAMSETNGWHGSTGNEWLRHRCGLSHWVNYTDGVCADCGITRARPSSLFGFYGLSYYNTEKGGYNGSMWPTCVFHGNPAWSGSGGREYDNTCIRDGMVTKQHNGRAVVVVGSGV